MLRSLGSVLCVVVMAAFVFGCGGGGGTAQMPDPMPDPGPTQPTDAEQIADEQQAVATILSNARTRAAAASSAASALGTNTDATADQRALAGNHNTDAQDALSRLIDANNAARVATTLAAAQAARADATTAQSDLNTAALAISTIERTVLMVTNAREQREADVRALTNNSSLIQHLRDNKLVFDAILTDLKNSATDPLTVVAVADTSNLAVYPKDTGTGAARVVGMRGVTVNTLTSGRTTPTLTGTSTLRYGFDLKNDSRLFVNAYTDITKTRVVRTQTELNDPDTPANETAYEDRDVADTDYLLAGIWLTPGNAIEAFAYGSQPLDATIATRCGITEGTSDGVAISGTFRICNEPSSASNISDFVEDGRDVNATYRGQANGARLAAGATSYFTGDVNLTAQFVNPTGGVDVDNNGSIEGAVTNIVVGGESIAGSIELQKQTFENAIGEAFEAGEAVGVVEGKSYSGAWKGQFFGQEFRRFSKTETIAENDPTRKTTVDYKTQAPGSVAGNFYVVKQSTPEDEAFIGAFGANR